MELALKNLLNFLTIAPHLVPEVFSKQSVRNPIAVSLGAIAGSLSRYYLSIWLAQRFGTSFPYATIFINLTGSFTMGLITTLVLERTLLLAPESNRPKRQKDCNCLNRDRNLWEKRWSG